MTLLSAEKVQVEWIAVLSQANRGLVEERCPLEGRTVKALALRAVAVLGVDRIAVVFEFELSTPTLCAVLDLELVRLPAVGRLCDVSFLATSILSRNGTLPSRIGRFFKLVSLTSSLLGTFVLAVCGVGLVAVLSRHCGNSCGGKAWLAGEWVKMHRGGRD